MLGGRLLCMQDKQQQQRGRLVKAALAMTENTPLFASAYERALLDKFVQGEVLIERVLELLAEHQK